MCLYLFIISIIYINIIYQEENQNKHSTVIPSGAQMKSHQSTHSTPAPPRRSERLHTSPTSVTTPVQKPGISLEDLIRFADQTKLKKKADFSLHFYFVNSNQAQRTLAQQGLTYFSDKAKRYAFTPHDIAAVTNGLDPRLLGTSADGGVADPYTVVFKVAKQIGNCASYLNATLPAHGGGCEVYFNIDNSAFFRIL
jgi:hypothetical protein